MITPRRFRWEIPQDDATRLLSAAYAAEVERRGRILTPDEHTRSNVKRVAEVMTRQGGKAGMMLCGLFGNGKTTMVYALQSATNYLNARLPYVPGRGIVIVDAKEVAQYARDQRRWNELRRREVLAVEDMGREPNEIMEYGNVISPVIDLLEYRYNHQLYTIITTNLRAEDVRGKYGPRIADRFNEMLDVIIFRGESYRRGGAK